MLVLYIEVKEVLQPMTKKHLGGKAQTASIL